MTLVLPRLNNNARSPFQLTESWYVNEPPQGRRKSEALTAMRFVGFGMELAGSVLVLAGVGYLIDRYFENSTAWGVLCGSLVGFGFGIYNLFRLVAKINQ